MTYGLFRTIGTGARPATPIVSLGASNPPTCGAGTDKVRAGDRHEDGEGARPHRATHLARPRRRGDRIELHLLRCMSPKLAHSRSTGTSALTVGLGGQADQD
jgi:hypothetical protein